uniref:Uncharacterized protein n=1 Tax=Ananas comosus var. bracteatus TaxID=296719 RepID=A0A6V7QEF1_ANACO|nr:unnamed protein product [Ananas comosus var. bracteatus]
MRVDRRCFEAEREIAIVEVSVAFWRGSGLGGERRRSEVSSRSRAVGKLRGRENARERHLERPKVHRPSPKNPSLATTAAATAASATRLLPRPQKESEKGDTAGDKKGEVGERERRW